MGSFDLDRIGGRRALAELLDVVLHAGDQARRMFDAGLVRWSDRAAVEMKPDRSPVTEADKAVEESGTRRRERAVFPYFRKRPCENVRSTMNARSSRMMSACSSAIHSPGRSPVSLAKMTSGPQGPSSTASFSISSCANGTISVRFG